MTTTDISPLPSGRAVAELDGRPRAFDNWSAAVTEVRRLGRTPNVLPFPMPRLVTSPPEVLAVAPILRVLDYAPKPCPCGKAPSDCAARDECPSVTGFYAQQRYPSGRPGWLGPDQDWPCSRCKQEVSSSELHECVEPGSVTSALNPPVTDHG